jgi:hypothetical protein
MLEGIFSQPHNVYSILQCADDGGPPKEWDNMHDVEGLLMLHPTAPREHFKLRWLAKISGVGLEIVNGTLNVGAARCNKSSMTYSLRSITYLT